MQYSTHKTCLLPIALCALVWVSCGSHPASPTTPTPPSPTPPPATTVTKVAISGNGQLTGLGQTSQLTATATLSDNTTTDATARATWTVSDARVATVSTTGLLTVMQFGAASVSVQYQNRYASLGVTATPSGTFVIAGRVREPGAGGIANVQVVDTMTGRATTSDSEGEFSLAELSVLQAHFKAEPPGYEPTEVDATRTNVDLPLQRVVRLTAGETVKPDELAPNDLSYTVGTNHCIDCHLIRVVVPQAGTVHVHVTWAFTASQLSLFAEGQVVAGTAGDLTADFPVNAPREVLMYLGGASLNSIHGHTPFTFETAMH
jgi:hypothetical protein